jgi:hypothetical protein
MSLSQWTSPEDVSPQTEQTSSALGETSLRWKNLFHVTLNPSGSESVTTAIALDTSLLNARALDKHEDDRPTSRTTWTRTKT